MASFFVGNDSLHYGESNAFAANDYNFQVVAKWGVLVLEKGNFSSSAERFSHRSTS